MNVLTRCKELGSVYFARRAAILKIQQSDLFVGNINTVKDLHCFQCIGCAAALSVPCQLRSGTKAMTSWHWAGSSARSLLLWKGLHVVLGGCRAEQKQLVLLGEWSTELCYWQEAAAFQLEKPKETLNAKCVKRSNYWVGCKATESLLWKAGN